MSFVQPYSQSSNQKGVKAHTLVRKRLTDLSKGSEMSHPLPCWASTVVTEGHEPARACRSCRTFWSHSHLGLEAVVTDAFLLLCYPSSLADSCVCLAAVGLEAGSQGGPHMCLSKSSRGLSKGTRLTRSFSPLMCTSFQFGKCSVINIFSEFPGNLGLMTGFLIITTNVSCCSCCYSIRKNLDWPLMATDCFRRKELLT